MSRLDRLRESNVGKGGQWIHFLTSVLGQFFKALNVYSVGQTNIAIFVIDSFLPVESRSLQRYIPTSGANIDVIDWICVILILAEFGMLPRYKIFLTHSGHQKDFVTQLCVDLERFNYFPFFEQSPDIFHIGESYASLIQQVARQCSVVVIVLSKDYVVCKRTMVELSTFVQFQKTENPDLKLLPLLYHFSPSDLNEKHLFKEHWEELVEGDKTINIELWIQSIRVLRSTLSLNFHENSEVEFRANVVRAINHIIQDSYHASKVRVLMDPFFILQ